LRDSKQYNLQSISDDKTKRVLGCLAVADLKNCLWKEEFTSVELLTVLINRAVDLARKMNWSCDENFEEALENAKKCDKQRLEAKKAGKDQDSLGLLHGIPISIKDHVR
jgi:Asp-tRNA(Asn)/Glu-tRNA(Gln) amidotransferase A subunit family amidase